MENKQLYKAMIKARSSMVAPEKDKINPMFKSKYATLDSIYNAAIPRLLENNVLLVTDTEVIEGKYMAVGNFIHESGESMQIRFPMVIEKQTAHGMASARAYACKYIVMNGLSLPSEDDDGNAASDVSFVGINSFQEKTIRDSINGDQALIGRILKSYGVNNFCEIASSEYKLIMDKLNITPKERKAQ